MMESPSEHTDASIGSNGRFYVSWHWLAMALLGLVGTLIWIVWNSSAQAQTQNVQSLSTRVDSVEASTANQGAQIEIINGDIIRICNKLGISQCE